MISSNFTSNEVITASFHFDVAIQHKYMNSQNSLVI